MGLKNQFILPFPQKPVSLSVLWAWKRKALLQWFRVVTRYIYCDTFVATKVPQADGSLELRKSLSVNFGVTKP